MVKTAATKEKLGENKLLHNERRNSIVRENKIKMYNDFLTELFLELVKGPKKLSMVDRCRKKGLPTWLPTILVQQNILEKIGKGIHTEYKWVDINVEPDDAMAEGLLNAYDKAAQESNQKVQLKKQSERQLQTIKGKGLVPIDKEKLVQEHLSQNDIEKLDKIKKFLEYAYSYLNGVSDPIPATKLGFKGKIAEFKLSSVTLSSIIKLEIIEKFGVSSGSSYLWKVGAPDVLMASQVLEAEKNYVKGVIVPITNKLNEDKNIIMHSIISNHEVKEQLATEELPPVPSIKIMVSLAKKLIKLKEFDSAHEVLEHVEL